MCSDNLSVVRCCVLFAFVLTSATAQEQCTTVDFGHAYGYPKDLDDIIIEPGVQYVVTKEVKDPCGSKAVIGKTVTACDYDVPPLVQVFDLKFGQVYRHSDYQQEAVISTLVYCDPL